MKRKNNKTYWNVRSRNIFFTIVASQLRLPLFIEYPSYTDLQSRSYPGSIVIFFQHPAAKYVNVVQ